MSTFFHPKSFKMHLFCVNTWQKSGHLMWNTQQPSCRVHSSCFAASFWRHISSLQGAWGRPHRWRGWQVSCIQKSRFVNRKSRFSAGKSRFLPWKSLAVNDRHVNAAHVKWREMTVNDVFQFQYKSDLWLLFKKIIIKMISCDRQLPHQARDAPR